MKELLIMALGLTLITPQIEGWKPAPYPKKRHKFVVIAHRGDHTQAPENTLEALHNTIADGADYMEVDLRTTKDGHIVIMHDSTVDRMTDGKGKIAEMTLEEFRALHIVDSRFPNRPPEPPPTFEEILQAARGKLYFYLDCKEVDPKQVWGLLKKHKMERAALVYTYGDDWKRWREECPRLPIMVSPPNGEKTPEALEAWWKTQPVELLDGGANGYTRAMVEAAKRWGVETWPDIQNPGESPEQWGKALELGFQGLQSDHPAQLIAYLKSIGRW